MSNKKPPIPKISVCVPVSDMPNGDFFLQRLQNSLEDQTFRDFEVCITKSGSMPVNTNAAIKRARGELVKVLYMDDFLAHENSLQEIVDTFTGEWLVTGCNHTDGEKIFNDHLPSFGGIPFGRNTIGSPSVLTMRRETALLFDEHLSWLLDLELYGRLYEKYGLPTILNTINVTIGIHSGQMTNLLTDEEKQKEYEYLKI